MIRQVYAFGLLAAFVLQARDKAGAIVDTLQPSFQPRGSFERADAIDAMRYTVNQWKRAGYTVTRCRPTN